MRYGIWPVSSTFPSPLTESIVNAGFIPLGNSKAEGAKICSWRCAGWTTPSGFPCDNMTTLGHYIFTGILERFPKLRLGILESNAGWLPFWLGRMDDHTHGRNSVMGKSEKLRMRPSEYFMRQCIIACDSDERALKYVVDYLQGENIVWNTDYPHPDAIEPSKALPEFDAQPIGDEARRKILWDNAVKLFGPRILELIAYGLWLMAMRRWTSMFAERVDSLLQGLEISMSLSFSARCAEKRKKFPSGNDRSHIASTPCCKVDRSEIAEGSGSGTKILFVPLPQPSAIFRTIELAARRACDVRSNRSSEGNFLTASHTLSRKVDSRVEDF